MIALIYLALIVLFCVGSFVSGFYQFVPGIVFCVSMSSFSGWQLGRHHARKGL